MADRPEDPTAQALNEVAIGELPGSVKSADTEIPSADRRYGEFVDWRKIDPSTIQGTNIPVEELRFYRENIDELLQSHEGQYVLIVGREIIAYFEDLGSAARHAEREFRGQTLLVKKVARFDPIQSIG
jgi:Family of unknown function (DUF5678)